MTLNGSLKSDSLRGHDRLPFFTAFYRIPSKELLADLLQPRDLCCMSVMVRRIQPRAQPQLMAALVTAPPSQIARACTSWTG
jgi:hypothetical protein